MMDKTIKKSTGKKVLICDDEEGIRESLKLILGDHYELMTVESGDQCVETLKHAPDIGLVLLDIKMPKVHGLDILVQIKKVKPSLPVIMVTGYRSVDTATESSARGASDYIIKPFDSKAILENVKRHLP